MNNKFYLKYSVAIDIMLPGMCIVCDIENLMDCHIRCPHVSCEITRLYYVGHINVLC